MDLIEREEELCPSCQGRLTTPEGKPCYCILARSVRGFLPGSLSNHKWGREFLEFRLPDRRTKLADKVERSNLLFWTSSEYRYHGTLKTWLVYQYLRTAGKFTYLLTSGYNLVNSSYREDASREEGEYKYQDFVSFDFLGLSLGFDPPNKTYSNFLMTLLQDRDRLNLRTWVWVQPLVTKGTFIEKYGNELYNYLVVSPKGSNFVHVELVPVERGQTESPAAPDAGESAKTLAHRDTVQYK